MRTGRGRPGYNEYGFAHGRGRYGGRGGIRGVDGGLGVLFAMLASGRQDRGRTPGYQIAIWNGGGAMGVAKTNATMIVGPYGGVNMYRFGRTSPTYGEGGPRVLVLYGYLRDVYGFGLGGVNFYLSSFFLYIYVGGGGGDEAGRTWGQRRGSMGAGVHLINVRGVFYGGQRGRICGEKSW